MSLRLLALACLVIAGCSPRLGAEGYYACATNGHCPPSAPVCGADRLCHVAGDAGAPPDTGLPADAGIDAAMPPNDTGVPPLTYPACHGAMPGSCGADSCYYDSITADDSGYCTRACVTDADCPSAGGAPSHCVERTCRRGCLLPADCPSGLSCNVGRWTDDGPSGVCTNQGETFPSGWYSTCTADAECARPLSCVAGRCLRACASDASCADGYEGCVGSAGGQRGCLYYCRGAMDCDGLAGATCSTTCRPPAW